MIAKIPPRDFGTFSTRLDLDLCCQHESEPNVTARVKMYAKLDQK